MPIAANLHRPVSRRGQWRGDHFIVAADGIGDTDGAIFRLEIRSQDRSGGRCDYGASRISGGDVVLSARTDDETSQFTVTAFQGGLACVWLFPAERMRALCAGSYEASISVVIGDEDAELVIINFVVR